MVISVIDSPASVGPTPATKRMQCMSTCNVAAQHQGAHATTSHLNTSKRAPCRSFMKLVTEAVPACICPADMSLSKALNP